MVRPLRIHLPGGCYHVTLRGNHQQDIFSLDSDRVLLNSIVECSLGKCGARIHAYCWMSNHLHLLVQVGNEPLGSFVRQVASGYARSYQLRLETTGHLFERRYHAILVDTDSYLLELVRYIHLNPVRSALVSAACQYRWSSHHAYMGAPVDPWVTTQFALDMLSPDRNRAMDLYREFVTCDPQVLRSPFDELRKDCPFVLGSDEFVAKMACGTDVTRRRQALEELVVEASRRFRVPQDSLRVRVRNPRVALARAWVAIKARERKLGSLSAVARMLKCDPKALRHAIERFKRELLEAG
jgi:putative transposase